MRLLIISLSCLGLSCLVPLEAQCESGKESGKESIKARVELLTDAPLHIGVGALFEGPKGLRVSTSLGWMPNAYVQGANDIVRVFVPTYTEETAKLVEDTIQNSLVWRIHGGWRPFSSMGFYTHVGYTFVGLGGGSTARSLLEGITGQSFDSSPMRGRANTEGESVAISAEASLHLFDIELGWEWSLSGKESQSGEWTLRTALGWSYTFTSTAQLNSEVDETQPGLNAFFNGLESAGELYLLDTFESYIHPPSLTVALGYQW